MLDDYFSLEIDEEGNLHSTMHSLSVIAEIYCLTKGLDELLRNGRAD